MGVLCKAKHGFILGYCAKGMRSYLSDKGLDYLRFVREGLDSDILLSFDDEMANRLVEVAKKEENK